MLWSHASHLYYCNSLLYGIPQYQFNRLQRILNAAARVVCQVPRFEHITPSLKKLHWLPVRYRVQFKIALLVFKVLHGEAPLYLENLLQLKNVGTYRLRSSGQKLLVVPRTTCKTFGDRAFCKAGPVVWNSLPLNIRETSNATTFKKLLKTSLFTKAYDL